MVTINRTEKVVQLKLRYMGAIDLTRARMNDGKTQIEERLEGERNLIVERKEKINTKHLSPLVEQ